MEPCSSNKSEEKPDDEVENADKSIEDEPSTSSATIEPAEESFQSKQEMEQLLQATNEMLETKAKSMNLSSLNVRSILHHLIKYPSTIDVLLGIRESDDLPTVRNTRSRKKPGENGSVPSSATQTPKKFALRIEDKGPKSFLDLEYQEDDEYDEDYVEEVEEDGTSPKDDAETGASEDEEENEDEEEIVEEIDDDEFFDEGDGENLEDLAVSREEERAESSIPPGDDDLDGLMMDYSFQPDKTNMSMTLNDSMPRSESAAPVPTLDNLVFDDDYRDFVNSIKCPNEELIEERDTDEDEDYNVIAETNLEVEDWYETRQDKTTMIPRYEVRALMLDTLLSEKEIPINVFPEDAIVTEEEEAERLARRREAEDLERHNFCHVQSSESCSLLRKGPVTFRPSELEQLQMQLEQHVQLLTQFVVTCHHDMALADVRNHAQIMLNELDDERNQKTYVSVLHVANLDAAMESCHDINGFDSVDDDMIRWDTPYDNVGGPVIRPEAAAVLSRSMAIRYPILLPRFQPVLLRTRIPFLAAEDLMLALALLQFAHLGRRTDDKDNKYDRYTAISQHCLPARTPYQIRSHLKTMRRSQAKPSPIHLILQAAEKGVCNATLPEKDWVVTNGPISMWPEELKPNWYGPFHKRFVVTENRKIHRRHETRMVVTPIKKQRTPQQIQIPMPEVVEMDYVVPEEESDEDYMTVGEGPGGQKIVMDRDHLQELMMTFLKEKESPSKRRKNPTPMKLPSNPDPHLNSNSLEHLANVCAEVTRESSQNIPSTSSAPSVVSLPSTSSEVIQKAPPSTRMPSLPMEEHPEARAASESDCSFENPPTPGRGAPVEDMMDLETNSLTWFRSCNSVTMGNPRTPRGFVTSSDPVDFSCLLPGTSSNADPDASFMSSDAENFFIMCQKPMGMTTNVKTEFVMEDFENSPFHSSESTSSCSAPQPTVATPSEYIDDDSMTGLDLVPKDEDADDVEDDDDEVDVENKRKRRHSDMKETRKKKTKAQREALGAIGLEDEEMYSQQKAAVVKQVIEEVKQKLFMHMETWRILSKTMTDEEATDSEKVQQTISLLSDFPELLRMVLLHAPPSAIPPDFQADPLFESYKLAVEMILTIERYVASTKIRTPSVRSIFRYIVSFLETDPDLSGEAAARKFFQLLGQDRPLWKRIEKNFYCLAHRKRPENVEKFEFVDLSRPETIPTKRERREMNNIPAHFEVIDDIDQCVTSSIRPARYEEKPSLEVKCGELCVRTEQEDEYIQLEITERQWTRKDDITLLTRYNDAVRNNPHFDEHDTPSLVPELHFGTKSIVARLRYLLAELKAIESV